MTGSGSSSFSVATTIFVSLAICAVISYGVFYYFKQRLSVIEQSQMEQARVMQAFIARSIMHQHGGSPVNQMHQMYQAQEHPVHKEVNITESGLIEVSSDSESESDDSESESTTSESSDCDNDSGSESESETTKHIQIHFTSDDAVVADVITEVVADAASSSEKKIISLNKTALGNTDDESESESESESGDEHSCDHEDLQDASFELKIGYKNKDNKDAKENKDPSKIHLNYGNMSVPALRQLAKERGLVNDDGDLQKLKKKDLIQLLTN
jgi:hypothetical protein